MGWSFSVSEARRLSWYLGEFEFQAMVAKQGATLMLSQSDDVRRRFMWAQMFLGACAMMSKQLWPPRSSKTSRWRASNLRNLLEVKNDCVLKSRDARNWLEHVDEKFDELLIDGVNITDYMIAPKSIINVPDMNFLRCMDVGAKTLSIAGVDVPYEEALRETQRLGSLAAVRKGEMDAIVFSGANAAR